ncbi:MAG: DUF3368 domain-containing protein [Burkholderiales bacterium]
MSNTSPLMNLAAIGRQDLLPELFGEVRVTSAVLDELEAGGPGAPATGARKWPWLLLYSPLNSGTATVLGLQLDRGEAQTLAAALELKPVLVLMDEKLGRRAAAALGIPVLGTIGVLLAAKHKALLPAVRPVLDELRNRAGFWVGEAVYQQALLLAGETE